MGFSLSEMMLAVLLCMNAMAVLHEKRFLNKSAATSTFSLSLSLFSSGSLVASCDFRWAVAPLN